MLKKIMVRKIARIGSGRARMVFKKSKQVRIEIPAHWLQCNVPGTKDESRNEENARGRM